MPKESKKVVNLDQKVTNDEKSITKKKTTTTNSKTKATSSAKKKATINKELKTKTSKKTTSATSSTKKETIKKKDSASKNRRKTSSKPQTPATFLQEYYDLPYRYNDTVVRVLAQTPTMLFIYWDISDDTREKWLNDFGKDFLNKTKPVLIIHNETKSYDYEIEIDDFANSWYLEIPDAKCQYRIELGRRPKVSNYSIPHTEENYIYVTSSNEIEAPNDHILFEEIPHEIEYKNIKTNEITHKNIDHLPVMKGIEEIYNIYDLYHEIYKDDITKDSLDLKKPSSANPSSTFHK